MSIYRIFGILSFVFSFLAFIPYIISTINGRTRPNPTTWIIWCINGSILSLSYSKIDGSIMWVPLGYILGDILTIIVSLKYEKYKFKIIPDMIYLSVITCSSTIWLITSNSIYTFFISIFNDFLGAIPTILKSYKDPKSECVYTWYMFFIGNLFGFLSFKYQFSISSIYQIYLLCISLIICIPLTYNVFSNVIDQSE